MRGMAEASAQELIEPVGSDWRFENGQHFGRNRQLFKETAEFSSFTWLRALHRARRAQLTENEDPFLPGLRRS